MHFPKLHGVPISVLLNWNYQKSIHLAFKPAQLWQSMCCKYFSVLISSHYHRDLRFGSLRKECGGKRAQIHFQRIMVIQSIHFQFHSNDPQLNAYASRKISSCFVVLNCFADGKICIFCYGEPMSLMAKVVDQTETLKRPPKSSGGKETIRPENSGNGCFFYLIIKSIRLHWINYVHKIEHTIKVSKSMIVQCGVLMKTVLFLSYQTSNQCADDRSRNARESIDR